MSKNNKEKLGQGLKAIFSNYEQLASKSESGGTGKPASGVEHIPVDKIIVNPFQPRKEFDTEELDALADSLRTHGLIQPITVRRLSSGQYQLISGERRWRAAQVAEMKEIPAYIRDADDQGMIELALIENIQREDLNPLEVAFAYQQLMEESGLTQEQMAERVSKKRSTVANYLRLLSLPPEIQKSLKENRISMGHARVLAGIKSLMLQLDLHRSILDEGLSVRALERKAKTEPKKATKDTRAISPELQAVRDKLSEQFGTKVSIPVNAKGAGKLIIPFKNTRQLNEILEILG